MWPLAAWAACHGALRLGSFNAIEARYHVSIARSVTKADAAESLRAYQDTRGGKSSEAQARPEAVKTEKKIPIGFTPRWLRAQTAESVFRWQSLVIRNCPQRYSRMKASSSGTSSGHGFDLQQLNLSKRLAFITIDARNTRSECRGGKLCFA
jgi:hypothetical protein